MNPTQRYNDLRKLVASLKTDDLAVLQRDINLILSLHEPIVSKTPALDAVDVKPVLRDRVRDASALLNEPHDFCAMVIWKLNSDQASAICRELGLDPDARG